MYGTDRLETDSTASEKNYFPSSHHKFHRTQLQSKCVSRLMISPNLVSGPQFRILSANKPLAGSDFAGSSTELHEGRPEYDATVGATVRFQRDHDGKQPGDPLRAAAALVHITSLPEPPLRLLLGSDAYNAAEKHALQILASDREWKDLSILTDYRLPGAT